MLHTHPKDALQYTASRQRECREMVEQARRSNPVPGRSSIVRFWSSEARWWGRFSQIITGRVTSSIHSLKALYGG
jgi:hypothetical protein